MNRLTKSKFRTGVDRPGKTLSASRAALLPRYYDQRRFEILRFAVIPKSDFESEIKR
jgi:hypothetical protein